MGEAQGKEQKRILILCVDRDGDLTTKAEIKTPIVGRKENLDAAVTLALHDPEEYVRIRAVAALGQIGDPQVLPELERVEKEDLSTTPSGFCVAEMARNAIEKIRQRMAASQKGTE